MEMEIKQEIGEPFECHEEYSNTKMPPNCISRKCLPLVSQFEIQIDEMDIKKELEDAKWKEYKKEFKENRLAIKVEPHDSEKKPSLDGNSTYLVQPCEIKMPSSSPSSSIQPLRSDENWQTSRTQENIGKPKASNINACRKRPYKNMDLSLETVYKRIYESLNDFLKKTTVEEDDCEIYGKLLGTKLRKYPQQVRDRIMYQIDLLVDNYHPDESSSIKSD